MTSNLQKYQSKNPVVQYLIRKFLRRLLDEVDRIKPKTIIDLGCGEGIVARAILDRTGGGVKYLGYDHNQTAIMQALRRNPEAEFCCRNILELRAGSAPPDLVLCLEVMEHIEDTQTLLKRIAQLEGRHTIISVPWEPYFRLGSFCRGLHLHRFGNHPEHLHCFGIESFRRAVSRCFSHVRIERRFPWLLGICSRSVSSAES